MLELAEQPAELLGESWEASGGTENLKLILVLTQDGAENHDAPLVIQEGGFFRSDLGEDELGEAIEGKDLEPGIAREGSGLA